MIKILKRQLFSAPFLLASLLFLPFCGFIMYAMNGDPRFLGVISAVLALNAGLLIFFHRQWLRVRAEYDIQQQDFLEQANLLESGIARERQGVVAVQKKIVDYSQLKVIAERLNQCFSLEDTSRVLSSEVSRLFGEKDSTAILYVFHSKTGELGISASQKGQLRVNLKEKKGDLYDHWVIKNMQALLIEDTRKDFRFDAEKAGREGSREVRSLMSVPMVISNKTVGILRIDSHKPDFFYSENLRLLTTIADLGVVAIESAQLYEKIEDMAVHDGLTGLFLRRHFLDAVSRHIDGDAPGTKEMSFVMIDLDHFKTYNDTYGHTAGDIVLKAVGRALTAVFNDPGSMVCRFGGEEFAVFLPDCSKVRAVALAESLRARVAGQAVILRREKTVITVSSGVATFPQDARTQDDLIARADQALYRAKKEGRNCVRAA